LKDVVRFGLLLLVWPILAAAPAPSIGADGKMVRSLLEIRRDGVVVQNWDLSSGAAALATLLTYQHGDPVPEKAIAEAMIGREAYLADPDRLRQQQGFSLLDLKRFVEGRGYRGSGFGGLDLAALVDLAPAILPVRLNGYDHFVVFRGMMGDRVLLADPAWGNRTLRVERFMAAWSDTERLGRVAFVVERRDGLRPLGALAPSSKAFMR
jgi:predicted double-glycine peptidase